MIYVNIALQKRKTISQIPFRSPTSSPEVHVRARFGVKEQGLTVLLMVDANDMHAPLAAQPMSTNDPHPVSACEWSALPCTGSMLPRICSTMSQTRDNPGEKGVIPWNPSQFSYKKRLARSHLEHAKYVESPGYIIQLYMR